VTPEDLARRFHAEYERLAPEHGYETRAETRSFDPATPNGRLMVAACGRILDALMSEREPVAWVCPECGEIWGMWADWCDGNVDREGTTVHETVKREPWFALGYINAPPDRPPTDAPPP
jgi:hypothetical protein